MSPNSALDVDVLVAAVAGAEPAGADLRYQPIFDEIKAARRAAEEEPGELGPWRKIADLVTRASTKSKDLQLGIWLLEASARIDGYSGATLGLSVLRRLLDTFWDSIYPQLDPDDPDPAGYRRALLHWVNDRLPAIVKSAPLTGPAMLYGVTHYEVTLKTGDEKRALIEQGWPNADQFTQAVNATATAALQQMLEVVASCGTELAALQEVVDRRFNAPAGAGAHAADTVVFVRLKESLDTAIWILERGLERRKPAGGGTGPSDPQDQPGGTSGPDGGGRADAGWSEALQLTRESRVDGLRLLQAQVAAAASGREQFLRQLQLAELALEAGVYSLAYPVFDELMRTIDTRSLEEWEERAIILRVMKGLVRCCGLVKGLNPAAAARESEILGRMNLSDTSSTS